MNRRNSTTKKRKPRTIPPLPPLDPGRRYPIDLAAALLSISRARLYVKIAAGEVTTIKDGHRRFVPGSEIARLSSIAIATVTKAP